MAFFVHADEIDDCLSSHPNDLQPCIDLISQKISSIDTALSPLQKESSDLQSKITLAKKQITTLESQINLLSTKLIGRQTDLGVQQILMNERIKTYYINTKKYNPFLVFFAAAESSDLIRQYTWYQSIITQDQNLISKYTTDITTLNQNKTDLTSQQTKLSGLKKTMESRFGYLSGEIKKAEDYKQVLSARQQQLIAQKLAMFNTSVGDASTSDDPASRADYNPGFSPAFAVFSFGAPHRKGMSQYGAFARAKAGQDYQTILKAYYGDIKVDTVNTSGSIKTTVGSLPFEDNYLVGIAEMPATWGDQGGYEALKAQAIAARTYALNYTNNLAGSICVDENCQVYSRSRLNAPGRWKQAVEDTKGMVIKSNKTGNIFSTLYASTSGGAILGYSSADHSTNSLWDTTCGNQSCWPQNAFEKISSSPWFYKGWYKTRDNRSCGRSHPWLNQSEFSDIINAQIYFLKTHDSSHLSQIDTGGCWSKDPNSWSQDELSRQVGDKGGPVSAVNSITVDYSTGGYTQTVHVSTDKGNFDFNGGDFQNVFNLRAPGALTAKSSLFNIEKK